MQRKLVEQGIKNYIYIYIYIKRKIEQLNN